MLKPVWVEKYRPTQLEQVIMTDERMRSTFQRMITDGDIPNMLIHGSSGTGKSTISRVLLNELKVSKMDTLRIVCADEQIGAMRDKVRNFAFTMPLGDFKVVQLEEIDYLSQDAQGLLRTLIEDTQRSCRFIATCNYVNKLLPPLRSRFQEFEFAAPVRDAVLMRLADILDAEKIAYDVEDLVKIVDVGYPDVRKCIHLLFQSSRSGTLVVGTSDTAASDWKIQLLPLIESGDLKTARKLVCESATREELQDIYRFLYDNIHRAKKLSAKWDEAVVLIADYQRHHGFVADPEIHVAALFIELGAL